MTRKSNFNLCSSVTIANLYFKPNLLALEILKVVQIDNLKQSTVSTSSASESENTIIIHNQLIC